jgi:hypothetical protein
VTDEDLIKRLNAIHRAAADAHGAAKETNHRLSAVEKQQAVAEATLAVRVRVSEETHARVSAAHEALVGRLWGLLAGLVLVAVAALFALLRG